jgi:alkanesulfonate monooxygenase SsuD/methylene tetrahydromethanopterin reductase-like flavin-dependent oxidoreductase (luciferase family)
VGGIYREFLAKNGFQNETSDIYDEFKKSGFKSNHELVTDSMFRSLAISGTSDECRNQLTDFVNAGINQPILQFNPIGDTMDSFKLFKKTFLDE